MVEVGRGVGHSGNCKRAQVRTARHLPLLGEVSAEGGRVVLSGP